MFPIVNIIFFLTILTKTYPAVPMPSKGVPQIWESIFWFRSFAGATIRAMVRLRFFDSSPSVGSEHLGRFVHLRGALIRRPPTSETPSTKPQAPEKFQNQ